MRYSDLALLAAAASVVGHSTFQDLWVDGVDQAGKCPRLPPNNYPVTDITSDDMRCNVGGAIGISGVCTVSAGQTLTVEMHHEPEDRNCTVPAIRDSHYGPVIIYMSKANDTTTADGSTPWFKVAQDSYTAVNITLGATTLNQNCGKLTSTVHSDLTPGHYLVRAEVIALHVAGFPNGAQFFMSYYQVHLTGSGTSTP